MNGQLDLPWSQDPEPQPSARVLVFPGDRRIGQARHVAEKIVGLRQRSTERHAQSYWERIANDYHRMLCEAGVSEKEATRQLGRFKLAVREALAGTEARRA